jgi:drug/metabolite transporter (DMT)-like permease
MQQHTTSTPTKIACFVSMFAGIFAAVYAFVSRNPSTALVLGIAAIILGGLSVLKAHKNIDDTQVATAGIFMAVVACAVALWQMYN